MNEWLPITAEYSNAVLVAILPYFSDFAGRLELPVPKPITTAHVRQFNCDPRRDQFGGWVVLKSGFEFWFENGHVRGFCSPKSYAVLQDPASIPEYYGQPRIGGAQALELARDSLRKLGYDLKALYADLAPQSVTEPDRIGTNIVPYYRFQWEHPLYQGTGADVEINAATKTVEQLKVWNDSLWRAPPKISVPLPKSRKPSMDSAQSNALVRATLDDFSRFARRMELPLPLPLKMEHVARVEFSGEKGDFRLKLTNGYWLTRDLGRASGFFAPTSFYKRWFGEPFKPVGEYLGEWKMDEMEAVELARRTIRKAGYTEQQFESSKAPEIKKPKQIGPYRIPRYLIEWRVWHPTMPATALALADIEVDADSKSIKYASLMTGIQVGKTNRVSLPDAKPVPYE